MSEPIQARDGGRKILVLSDHRPKAVNTWYIYSPVDTDENGDRLMIEWNMSYEDAVVEMVNYRRETGKPTRMADEWYDKNIIGYHTHRRSAQDGRRAKGSLGEVLGPDSGA